MFVSVVLELAIFTEVGEVFDQSMAEALDVPSISGLRSWFTIFRRRASLEASISGSLSMLVQSGRRYM